MEVNGKLTVLRPLLKYRNKGEDKRKRMGQAREERKKRKRRTCFRNAEGDRCP